jgi:hypothetical protein
MREIKNLKKAVGVWFADEDLAIEIYGHINDWDVSTFTDMSSLFRGISFNRDINLKNWDVSNVSDATNMFQKSQIYGDIGLSNWFFPNLKSAEYMFNEAYFGFYLNLNNWKPAGTTFYGMFEDFSCKGLDNEESILPDMSEWKLSFFDKEEEPHKMFGGELHNFNLNECKEIVSKWDWTKELDIDQLFFTR